MLKGEKSRYFNEGEIPPKSDKYGIYAMRVGECIHIKDKNSTLMSSKCDYFRRAYNRKYVVRKEEGGGCYIWRKK